MNKSDLCRWLHERLEQLPAYQFPIDINALPENGIYFLYEKEEIWGHGEGKPRIVRVGTHTGDGNFKSRIREHFLLGDVKINISTPRPSDRSIFRKNIGRALLKKRQEGYFDIWDVDMTSRRKREAYANKRDIEKEISLEQEITDIIRNNFSFRFIKVDDGQERLKLEKQLIGTISGCSLCQPSKDWLGKYSPKEEIRRSGLWLVHHVFCGEEIECEKVDEYIAETLNILK